MPTKQISAEALLELHRRLMTLPPRSHERRLIMQDTARLYGVSEPTLYRALAARGRPKIVRRTDRGTPRILPQEQLERYCELIAAIKVRTSNKGFRQHGEPAIAAVAGDEPEFIHFGRLARADVKLMLIN